MSIPDFERAEYTQPPTLDAYPAYEPASRLSAAALPLALVYGVGAAILGATGYALVASTGFMVSIVAIGIGWFVARAMMTATSGIGGRPFQIAAAVLTYFSCTCGSIGPSLWKLSQAEGVPAGVLPGIIFRYVLFGPFLRFGRNPLWAAIGLLILFYGIRTAWQLAAGSPGFGQPGGRRIGMRGLR